MLRGINKQIIEIKCPNNECFEKILLFVKAENGQIPKDVLNKKSKQYYNSVMSGFGRIPLYKQRKFLLSMFALIMAALIVMGLFLII